MPGCRFPFLNRNGAPCRDGRLLKALYHFRQVWRDALFLILDASDPWTFAAMDKSVPGHIPSQTQASPTLGRFRIEAVCLMSKLAKNAATRRAYLMRVRLTAGQRSSMHDKLNPDSAVEIDIYTGQAVSLEERRHRSEQFQCHLGCLIQGQ